MDIANLEKIKFNFTPIYREMVKTGIIKYKKHLIRIAKIVCTFVKDQQDAMESIDSSNSDNINQILQRKQSFGSFVSHKTDIDGELESQDEINFDYIYN